MQNAQLKIITPDNTPYMQCNIEVITIFHFNSVIWFEIRIPKLNQDFLISKRSHLSDQFQIKHFPWTKYLSKIMYYI